ncbi:nucleotide-binding protein [Neobacillus drentensis]|uniref:nucleotide-binding protein n=1 Tax=Neobacillus drentensis TaxID=220684 RepID=UPI003001D3FB
MIEKLPVEASANEIIGRMNRLVSEYGVMELKIDWIRGGYGRLLWNKRGTEVIDFDSGFKLLVKQGIISFIDPNRIRLNVMVSNGKSTGQGEKLMNSKDEYRNDKSRVFIVHGHDDLAKTEVARFIEQLGLFPIILHEQANKGKTIIEKIEEYSNVGFGIVLYTPCDIGAQKDSKNNLKQRARQNVVFEHGFLMGKIGRENVAALVKGEVETPNDISGVVYINMDPFHGWQRELIKELKESGYEINIERLFK